MTRADDRFMIRDESTGEQSGPYGRLATRDNALARNIASGHAFTVLPVDADGTIGRHHVACCFDGQFMVEVPHDDEGNSLPCQPWIDGPYGELEHN